MFGVMGTSAAFAQAAGAKAPKGIILLMATVADPEISTITGTDIVVTTTKNGVTKTETYASLDGYTLSIQADANTQIKIAGTITECEIGQNEYYTSISATNTALTIFNCNMCSALTSLNLRKNTALTTLICSECFALTSLDLSTDTALTKLECASCTALTSLNLRKNTALTTLTCMSCTALTSLDLSTNTALTELNSSSVSALTEIKYPATNEGVSEAIALAITNATEEDGTVYTDSAAAYYSTIADAATAKGWTIAPLA